MQPAHLLTDIDLVERHWGHRGRGAHAFRSLLQRGVPLVSAAMCRWPCWTLVPASMQRSSGQGHAVLTIVGGETVMRV